MLVTYSLCGSLKTENYYQDINEEQPRKKSKLGRSKELIKRISVYWFLWRPPYENCSLSWARQSSMFIPYIQTNFCCSKNINNKDPEN